MEKDKSHETPKEQSQPDQPKYLRGIPTYEDKQERAQTTLKIINDGQYCVKIDIKKEIDESVKKTKLYDPDEELSLSSIEPNSQMCDFQVTVESTLQAARRIQIEKGIKEVVALNFASAIKPGGGWLNGREAQEECITRQSALYLTLKADQCSEFYNHHEALLDTYTPEAHLYTNYMIYSPNVPVIRSPQNEELILPFYVSFITSPATNLKKFKEAYRKNEHDRILHDYLSEKKKNEKPEKEEEAKVEEEEKNDECQKENDNVSPIPSYSYEPFEYSESYGPEYDLTDEEYDKIEAAVNESLKNVSKINNDVMYERCKRILEICILNKNQAIILGAFGCGVFGNDPSEIADIFHRLLVEEKYGCYFKVVDFAILGKPSGYSVSCFKNKFLQSTPPKKDD